MTHKRSIQPYLLLLYSKDGRHYHQKRNELSLYLCTNITSWYTVTVKERSRWGHVAQLRCPAAPWACDVRQPVHYSGTQIKYNNRVSTIHQPLTWPFIDHPKEEVTYWVDSEPSALTRIWTPAYWFVARGTNYCTKETLNSTVVTTIHVTPVLTAVGSKSSLGVMDGHSPTLRMPGGNFPLSCAWLWAAAATTRRVTSTAFIVHSGRRHYLKREEKGKKK